WFHEPTLWTRERGKDYSVTRVFAYPEEEIQYIAMNKFREVAGTFLLHYGFHWSNETGLTLQTGCSDSEVTDINDRGIMVGFCSEPPHLAFVWDGDGGHEYLPLPP